ncbi:putative type VI secretion system effector [Burkholderia glumae]|uniref:putative type VI secretion system effector n=2 Tax=Burkholderia glumae TaxID=337 RepID=UPI00131F7DEE|nr:putative type VI secretion system effector [Burkholderia glumae]MCM2494758.1 hypothetical protein [Burkholderia glumae]MCM2545622.1 hypothetical protein [Burkholderia glumae]MCR1769308.1 hypothetical protein [Burkholderia glumae]QHE13903.1 hypothetical protein GQR88_27445 [Burkholderia glumae AU6208]QHP93320.1 hypothetical protein EXE55_20660 [Burkholderia glumae]
MTSDTNTSTARLLRGRIKNLRKTRCRRDFVFTERDRANMGATAIAAGLAGLGGIAAGLGAMSIDTTEEADLLEFELDGMLVKAWVWVSVFKEGDEVEVVAEPDGDDWLGYGIRRISDRIVALHPHCSRGRYAHFRASARWWFRISAGILLIVYAIVAVTALLQSLPLQDWPTLVLACALGGAGSFLILGFVAYRVSSNFSGFTRLAEGIFQVFGWKNVRDIDLPAITKKTKTPEDPGALGVLYFRY